MDISTMTSKGQVVIPSAIRRRHGIKKGTKLIFLEKNGELIIKPVDDEYFSQFIGILKGGGKALKALQYEHRKENEEENSGL